MSLTCRQATEADIPQLTAFNRAASGTDISSAYWRWKYLENPMGPSGIFLALDGDRLVGMMAAFAMPMSVDGKRALAVQMGHNDVLKEYRSAGAYFQLSSMVTQTLLMQTSVDFCFGVAIEETRNLSTVLMGFDDAGPVHKLVRIVNPLAHVRKKTGLPLPKAVGRPLGTLQQRAAARVLRGTDVASIASFGDEFDTAWRNYRGARVMTWRDRAYLEWRYVRCPIAGYCRRQLAVGGEILGWVVYHTFDEAGVHYGILDECFSYADTSAAHGRIVNLAVAAMLEDSVDAMVAWAAPSSALYNSLRANRFMDRPAPRSLIVRGLSANLPADVLGHEANWYYTVGDSNYWLHPVQPGLATEGAVGESV